MIRREGGREWKMWGEESEDILQQPTKPSKVCVSIEMLNVRILSVDRNNRFCTKDIVYLCNNDTCMTGLQSPGRIVMCNVTLENKTRKSLR